MVVTRSPAEANGSALLLGMSVFTPRCRMSMIGACVTGLVLGGQRFDVVDHRVDGDLQRTDIAVDLGHQ
jgi:hypothetical protein